MKKTLVRDAWSGKELNIEYDLEKDAMLLNGVEVERMRELEDEGDPFVYRKKGGNQFDELYHLSKEQVENLRSK